MKLSTELGFDGEAAFKKATYYAEKYGAGYNSFEIIYAFKGGAFWQHLQDSAALSAIKGENEFLKTLIAQSNYRTENELEKLRAEKANEWKKMDEAKDAFAVHTTELENELEKLRAENEWLKGNISGHIGAVDIFCERNDNLLAENAILREGLKFYADVDNWENPCVINDPDLKAQKALTAADKVRGGG